LKRPSPDNIERDILLLYDAYAPKLLRYASTLVRDDSLAQDGVQEVFLRYSLMRKSGRLIATPRAWLFRVLRNYLLDVMKAAPQQNEVGMDRIPDMLDEAANPEQLYAFDELSRRIRAALTPRELECLGLRAEGLRYHEIADVLAIRPGTVAALLFRCNARLQEVMGSRRAARPALPAEEPYAP
jgi:RNA polymerase sigma-70 factor, ECF subfamily